MIERNTHGFKSLDRNNIGGQLTTNYTINFDGQIQSRHALVGFLNPNENH